MVNTKKFSQFATAPLTSSSTGIVGLESGVNVQSTRFLSWTTATRPASPFNGLMGVNTDLDQYEWYDAANAEWVQFEDSGDIAQLIARLAAHTVGDGASMIGLLNQSNVTDKTVQDLANATFIAQTDNGTVQNAQFLGSLTTGIVKSTTGTGVLSISAPLTSIDGLTTVANNMLYTTAPNVYDVIAPANDATLISSVAGVPSWSQTLPTTVQSNITQLGAQSQALNMNTHLINNVANPVSEQDAATKDYVDTLIANFAVIFVARLASTVALTATYDNVSTPPSGVGATLTNADVQAALVLDGVAAVNGDLVLIKNQASAIENGYYVVTDIGSGATNWVLTRSETYDLPAEINPGDLFVITAGNTQIHTTWIQTANVTSVGVDDIDFSQFSVALPIPVSSGGTGNTTFTAYSVICAGTTPTGAFQNVSGVGSAGQVLTSNGAAMLPTWQNSGGLFEVNVQSFTTSGTYTPTSGMLFCIIEVVGAGGGGGAGTYAAANNQAAGAGGGGGGYSLLVSDAATIGASQAVTIGAAGTAGTGGGNGGTGGNTTVGALITGNGGTGGTGGTNSAPPNLTFSGGAGGTGSGGSINISGGNGASGGVYGNGAFYVDGHGGSSMFSPSNLQRNYNTVSNVVGYGGGGQGGRPGDGVAVDGRAGTAGFVKITEFISS